MIPELDLSALNARDTDEMARLARAVRDIGFLTVTGTTLTPARVCRVLDLYRAFFKLPDAAKRTVDMARTGSNRGWGAPGSEQVNPDANPDFKEVFDCGYELPAGHPLAARRLGGYAPNLWPEEPADFRREIQTYYAEALDVGRQILAAIADVAGAKIKLAFHRLNFSEVVKKPIVYLRIPEDPPTHSDNMCPPVPGYSPTFDALP